MVTAAKDNPKPCVIQADFAENYKCVSQDEAANAHWGQSQVSIFTSAFWSSKEMRSFAITSDNVTHAKETVVPFIDRLFEELPKTAEIVQLWTDGPSSQFKNKFITTAQAILQEKYRIQLFWNFFPTSHGKGAVDGIGGALKRQVWDSVKTRLCAVSNAAEFTAAVKGDSRVTVIHVDSNEITSRLTSLKLDEKWKRTEDVRGIPHFHHIQIRNGKVHGFPTIAEGMDSFKNLK